MLPSVFQVAWGAILIKLHSGELNIYRILYGSPTEHKTVNKWISLVDIIKYVDLKYNCNITCRTMYFTCNVYEMNGSSNVEAMTKHGCLYRRWHSWRRITVRGCKVRGQKGLEDKNNKMDQLQDIFPLWRSWQSSISTSILNMIWGDINVFWFVFFYWYFVNFCVISINWNHGRSVEQDNLGD